MHLPHAIAPQLGDEKGGRGAAKGIGSTGERAGLLGRVRNRRLNYSSQFSSPPWRTLVTGEPRAVP